MNPWFEAPPGRHAHGEQVAPDSHTQRGSSCSDFYVHFWTSTPGFLKTLRAAGQSGRVDGNLMYAGYQVARFDYNQRAEMERHLQPRELL